MMRYGAGGMGEFLAKRPSDFGVGVEKQISPLRCASVEITCRGFVKGEQATVKAKCGVSPFDFAQGQNDKRSESAKGYDADD
jgi:hypothetical protein